MSRVAYNRQREPLCSQRLGGPVRLSFPRLAGRQPTWREVVVGLLPLALAGVLPGWVTALLCLIFTAGAFSPIWAEGRTLLSILVVGLITGWQMIQLLSSGMAAPDSWAQWLALGSRYFSQLLFVTLLSWAATRLADSDHRALLLVLLSGILTPQPGLLLALLGGALMRPGPDDRRSARRQVQDARVWAWVAGAALLAGLLLTATPLLTAGLRPETASTPAPAGSPASSQPVTPETATISPDPRPQSDVVVPSAPRRQVQLDWQQGLLPQLPPEVFLSVALLFYLGLFMLMVRLPTAAGPRPTLLDFLLAAGMVITFVVTILLSLRTGDGSGSLSGNLPQEPVGMSGAGLSGLELLIYRLVPFFELLVWLAFVAMLLLTAGLWWTWWKLGREPRDTASSEVDLPAPDVEPTTPPPLHRVRLAYRQAEALLRGSGHGRAHSETPAAYAQRLSLISALLGPPLQVLTRAYLPVRYGGQVSEEDAERAESAVFDLQRIIPTLPHLTDHKQAEDQAVDSLPGKDPHDLA